MKKLISLLGTCLLLTGHGQGATLTVSNYNEAGTGVHAIADSAAIRLGGNAGRGVIGRFTLSDIDVANKATAGDIIGLNAAFLPFDAADGSFALDSLGQAGAFETSITADTKASTRPGFGGSTVYFWLYKGTSRTSASEYLLVRSDILFPTDAEAGPPALQEVALNPDNVAALLAGTHAAASGNGEVGVFKMISTAVQSNVAPVAQDGTLAALSGKLKTGTLTATDANANDTLTFSKVTNPAKGTVVVNANGSYSYTAGPAELGADSFTFKVNDGTIDSNIATITITITAPPPNTAPVANAANFTIGSGNLLSASVTGSDGENDPLTFTQVSAPEHSSAFNLTTDGLFTYRSVAGFSGVDSFSFKVADDSELESAVVTVTIVVEQTSSPWSWVDGNNLPKQRGVYGSVGVPAPANNPGARTEAASASDNKGISYHFGGSGYGEGTKTGLLNDLWKYDATTGVWTWLSGSKEVGAVGVYGTKGTPAAGNAPGARSGALLWLDGAGDLWLFGGAASPTAFFNDLWKFDVSEGQWAWVSGNNTQNGLGAYGQVGVASAANAPGARSGAVGLTDPSGNLIVFGGRGFPEAGTKAGLLNDLWSYNPTSGQWIWLKGGKVIDAVGAYGTKGTAGSTQTPGGRVSAAGWIGGDGTLWVFGGNGRGTAAALGNLNDLWKYNVLANEWAWVGGSSTVNAVGVYGTQGEAAAANTPGARAGASALVAADGSLLLFGGQGTGYFNDVWRFDQNEGFWSWIKGPSTTNGAAFYGTLGEASSSSTPGSRRGSSVFADAGGDLVVFAGANGANTNNDVWHLELPNLPVVKLLPVTAIANNGATITVEINPNGAATTASLKLINLTSNEEEDAIVLDPLVAGSQSVQVSEALTGLDEGHRYAVQVEAENAFGEGSSQILVFTTTGTVPAIVASFENASSTVNEGDGTVNVVVNLTAPATEPLSIPLTFTGTATSGAAGDFVSPSTISFVTGQSQASVSVTLNDDSAVDPTETIIIQLEAPSLAGVTIGSGGTHTITIQDNDNAALARQLARLGGQVVFQSPLTGSGVTYQWQKNGVNIAKATLPTFTLASVKLTDAGSYKVVTKNAAGTTTPSDEAALTVVDTSSRTVSQQTGTALALTVPVGKATGGPALTFQWYKGGSLLDGKTSETLTIPVLALSDAGDYTFQVSDGVNSVSTGIIAVNVYETVTAPPAFLAGTYVGLVEVDEDAAPLGGRVDLTVTTKGAYTAKLTLGAVALTAKGQLSFIGANRGVATANFVRKGLPNLTLQFEVEGSAQDAPVIALSGLLADPFTGATTDAQGYRNNWVAKPKVQTTEQAATAYVGDYTFGLELPGELIGEVTIPQGNGFGALTVTAGGTATYTGRTADGGKFTVATIVGPNGDLPFYAAFTLTPGYLAGVTSITPAGENSGLDGSLVWKKGAADAKSKELAYRAGFDEIDLAVVGGKWKGPGNGEVIANLPDTAGNNALLVLSEGGPEVIEIDPFVFGIINQKTTAAQTVVVPKFNAAGNPNPNPNTVTFKLIAKPVGHYSGTFIVPNAVKALVRTVTYQGTFVRLPNGTFTSAGFFLLPQLPEPGQTVKTSPQLSGQSVVEANDLP